MRLILSVLFFLSFLSRAGASVYYVSPSGDDANPGTRENPLKTIQSGTGKLLPGDTLYVLPGTYEEAFQILRSGTASQPISIIAEPGTVLLDGAGTITGEWVRHEGDIYKIKATGPVEQIFYHDTMMVEARWPNMKFPEDLWKRGVWASSDLGSSMGTMIDAALAATHIDWTGALAILNIEAQFWTWSSVVTNHTAGSATFQYRTDNLAGLDDNLNFSDDYYYLAGKLEALDFPGEWYYDQDSDTLYVFKPGGGQPQPGEIGIKRLSYAITASDKDYVRLSGFDFFACTFRFENCDHCLIEKCEILYPAYSRDIPDRIKSGGSAPSSYISGDHNTVRECHISMSSGNGLKTIGRYNLVENNLIHDICWSGSLDYKAVSSNKPGGQNISSNIIRLNTVYNGGNALLGFSGPKDLVELNHVYAGGRLCKDVALIYTSLPICEFSQVRRNWVHQVYTPHIALGIRGDDKTRRLNVNHNVVWDIGWEGIIVKGDENHIYNNTGFDCDNAEIYLETGLEPTKDWHAQYPAVQANVNSFTYNNLVGRMYGNRSQPIPPSGDLSNNMVKPDYHGLLVNRKEHDFRPRLGSGLINRGKPVPGISDPGTIGMPDIGAYEFSDTNYWIPGHQVSKTSFPIPSDESYVESDLIDLIWKEAYKASSYEIYFGTSEQDVREATINSEEFRGNQGNNIFKPGMLEKDAGYYWRVDARYEDSVASGEVWSFTAAMDANPIVYTLRFQVFGDYEGDTELLEAVEITTPEMFSLTDSEGLAEHYASTPGPLDYKLFKKGYILESHSLDLLSDTLVVDTMKAAIGVYSLDILIKDSDTGEPLPGCKLFLNGISADSDTAGQGHFNDLSYGFYRLQVEKEGYISFPGTDSIELFSDSALVIELSLHLMAVLINVVEKASEAKIYRASVYAEDEIFLTNREGTATLNIIEGPLAFRIEHEDYFTLAGSLPVSGDTSLMVAMTPKLADFFFRVTGDEGPLQGASVSLNTYTLFTGSDGKTMFLNRPARKKYGYIVEKQGYLGVTDSVFIESDTTLEISLNRATYDDRVPSSRIRVFPNPAGDEILVTGLSGSSEIILMNAQGTAIGLFRATETKSTIRLAGIPAGIYFLRIQGHKPISFIHY